eukprot:gene5785-7381_t
MNGNQFEPETIDNISHDSIAPFMNEEGKDSTSVRSNKSVYGLARLMDALNMPYAEDLSNGKNEMQTMDWRKRPIDERMLKYLRMDVHFLIPTYCILVNRLVEVSLPPSEAGVDGRDQQEEDSVSPTCPLESSPSPSCEEDVMAFPTSMEGSGVVKEICAPSSVELEGHDCDEDAERVGVWTEWIVKAVDERPPPLFPSFQNNQLVVHHRLPTSAFVTPRSPPHAPTSSSATTPLRRALELCHEQCQEEWTPPVPCDEGVEGGVRQINKTVSSLMKKGVLVKEKTKELQDRSRLFLRYLVKWRERAARDADESLGYVCPADILANLAWFRPTDVHALAMVFTPLLPYFLDGDEDQRESRLNGLFMVVREAQAEWENVSAKHEAPVSELEGVVDAEHTSAMSAQRCSVACGYRRQQSSERGFPAPAGQGGGFWSSTGRKRDVSSERVFVCNYPVQRIAYR